MVKTMDSIKDGCSYHKVTHLFLKSSLEASGSAFQQLPSWLPKNGGDKEGWV